MLDQADILDADPRTPRVLVLAGRTRGVMAIARQLVARLTELGWAVELASGDPRGLPPPQDYDAIAIALHAAWPRRRTIARYVEWFRDGLDELPVALAVIGAPRHEWLRRKLGWLPSLVMHFERSRVAFDARELADRLVALAPPGRCASRVE